MSTIADEVAAKAKRVFELMDSQDGTKAFGSVMGTDILITIERVKTDRPAWWPDDWEWPHDPNADPLCLRALEDVPKTEEVHHPHTAFNQGWASYEGSYPRTCNPYRGKDDDLKESWDDGYQAAKDEEEFDDWES